MRCEAFISDHMERGDTTCTDPDHAAAIARRREGAAPWGAILGGTDGGGKRDFLMGQPINCGRTLLLQSQEVRSDDYGDYSVLLETSTAVRYEKDGDTIVLYTELGGHIATLAYNRWMRFRWPERSRIFG